MTLPIPKGFLRWTRDVQKQNNELVLIFYESPTTMFHFLAALFDFGLILLVMHFDG